MARDMEVTGRGRQMEAQYDGHTELVLGAYPLTSDIMNLSVMRHDLP